MSRLPIITAGLLNFLKFFVVNAVLIMAPALAISMGTSIKHMQFSVSLFFTGITLGILFIAPLGDSYQKRRLVLLLLPLTLIGAALIISATTLAQFMAGIFIFGFTIGPSVILAQAHIQKLLKDKTSVAGAMAVVILITFCAPVLGMIIGGYLIDYTKWQYFFIIVCSLIIICWLLCYSAIKKETGLNAKDVKSVFIHYWTLIKSPHFFFISSFNSLMMTGLYLFSTAGIYLLHIGLHYPLHIIAYSSIGFFLAGSIASISIIFLRKKLQLHILILIGCIISILSALTYLITSFFFTPHLALMTFFISVFVIGISCIGSLTKTVIMSRFPQISSAANSMNSIFQAIYSALISYICAHIHATYALPVAATLLGIGTLSALLFVADRLAIKYHNHCLTSETT